MIVVDSLSDFENGFRNLKHIFPGFLVNGIFSKSITSVNIYLLYTLLKLYQKYWKFVPMFISY